MSQPLVALLPGDTPVALQIHNLRDILTAYDNSPLAEIVATDVRVEALLLSSGDLKDLRQRRREAELEYHLSLGREFLLDWAGEEATLAFIPTDEKPTLVAITQAQLGFREKLAELMAQLYPGSQIVTQEHRGVSVTSYLGEEPRDSFSFCRFGETVAVALRTDSVEALHQIIDAVLAESPPEQPVFPPPTQPGIHGWADLDRLPAFLASLESDGVNHWRTQRAGEQILEHFTDTFAEVRLTNTLSDPRSVQIALSARDGSEWAAPTVTDWYCMTRPTTLAAAHVEPPAAVVASLVHSLMGEDDETEIDDDERWRGLLHDWFFDEIRPLLGDAPTLALDSVTPRMGLPALRACLRWPIADDPERLEVALLETTSDFPGTLFAELEREDIPETLLTRPTNLRLADHVFQTWPTPLGRLQWAIVEQDLLVMIDDPAQPLAREWIDGWEVTAQSASHHHRLMDMWGDAPRPGEVFIQLQPLSEISAAVLSGASLFSDSARKQLTRLRMAQSLVAVYPNVGVACLWTEEGLTVQLSFTRVTE